MPKPLYVPPKNRQLFFLGQDALNAMDADTVASIVSDLRELDLYRLPYEVVDLKVLVDHVVSWRQPDGSLADCGKCGPTAFLLLTGIGSDKPNIYIYDNSTSPPFWENAASTGSVFNLARSVADYGDFLVALLATKNVQKTVTENKLAAHGIGKERWRYTTTLSLPKDLQDAVANAQATGRTVRPHLRRGHIRRQHYGPSNEAVKKVWIAPVFVNADEGFESPRDAYNVRAA